MVFIEPGRPDLGLFCVVQQAVDRDHCRIGTRRLGVALIGPNDSESMHVLLDADALPPLPLFSTIATNTGLARHGNSSFIRLTTPNDRRAEMLLRKVTKLHPGRQIELYSATGLPESFSQALKHDLLSKARHLQLNYREQDFSIGQIDIELPAKNAPIVIAAVSADAVALLRFLRQRGATNQAFSFGSHTNWLTKEAVGTIVVCDLDRHSADDILRHHLDEFCSRHPSSMNPSIPTMNAGHLVVRTIAMHQQRFLGDVAEKRTALLQLLRGGDTLPGLLGPLVILPSGEMAGYEQIALQRVCAHRGGYSFKSVEHNEKPIVYEKRSVTKQMIYWIGFISAVCGLPFAKDIASYLSSLFHSLLSLH